MEQLFDDMEFYNNTTSTISTGVADTCKCLDRYLGESDIKLERIERSDGVSAPGIEECGLRDNGVRRLNPDNNDTTGWTAGERHHILLAGACKECRRMEQLFYDMEFYNNTTSTISTDTVITGERFRRSIGKSDIKLERIEWSDGVSSPGIEECGLRDNGV